MVATIIILSLLIPVTAAVTGFFVLKAVQLGLRWQVQVKQDQTPTMEQKEMLPIIPKARNEPEQDIASVMSEWINGPLESR